MGSCCKFRNSDACLFLRLNFILSFSVITYFFIKFNTGYCIQKIHNDIDIYIRPMYDSWPSSQITREKNIWAKNFMFSFRLAIICRSMSGQAKISSFFTQSTNRRVISNGDTVVIGLFLSKNYAMPIGHWSRSLIKAC